MGSHHRVASHVRFYTKSVYTIAVKNVTISLPEHVWEKLRKKARAADKSLNAFIGERLVDEVSEAQGLFADLEEIARNVRGTGKPWKWNREEIYEDRGKGLY